jgi:hypothetical protein
LPEDPESASSQQQLLLHHSSLEDAEESSPTRRPADEAADPSYWPKTAAVGPSFWPSAAAASWSAAAPNGETGATITASASQTDLNRASPAVVPAMRKATSLFSNMNLCSQTGPPHPGAGIAAPLLPPSALESGELI